MYKYYITFIYAIASISLLLAQKKEKINAFSFSDEVKIDNSFRFQSSYFSELKLNEDWSFRYEFYQTRVINGFSVSNLYEIPLLAKFYVNDKFSILAGSRFDVLKENGKIEYTGVLSTFGTQYNLNDNFIIESRFNYRLTKESPPEYHYSSGNRKSYKLGTKFKF